MRLRLLLALMAVFSFLAVIWQQTGGDEPASKPPAEASKVASKSTAADLKAKPAAEAKNAVEATSGNALADFDAWSKKFLASRNPDLIAQGVELAKQRRPVFKALILKDPREAIRRAVRPVERQKLPLEVVALLETPVEQRGVMRVYRAGPESVANGEKPTLRYVETVKGGTYEAHVFGRRAQSTAWVPNLSAIGVEIDGQLALDERPLRVMDAGEVPPLDLPRVNVCPISKIETPLPASIEPITTATPALIANGEVVYLCDGSHTTLYEELLIQGESSSGGAQSFTGILPAVATPSVGVVKVLFIPAIFPDQNETPITEAGAYDMMKQTADFYQVNSYGRLTLVATVTPPVRMPKTRAWYVGKDTTSGFIREVDGLSLEMSHAKDEARKLGYDWQDYHATIVRANGGARAPTSFGGGGNVWMRVDSVSTATHEIGHAFGLDHANYWETNGASIIGPGGNVEYGDNYDNMGTGSPPNAHYNTQAKNQIKWLPDEFAPLITTSGTYRLYQLDQPTLDPGKRYGLRVRKDNDRTYWGEYRLLGGNNWTNNGMLLGWKWPSLPGGDGSNFMLLDTTPGSVNGKSDAGITVGRTFSDTENGIHITTLAVNSTTTPPSLDMVVNLGDFPGNNVPTLALSPATTTVPTNTNVTFTATANDVDGDTLSYAWQWHDNTISGSGPTATRSFSSSGVYTLSCVVSDMKGGVAVRNSVITVGNGNNRFTISGRVTRAGIGLPNVTVGTGGANGTFTDSDGYYTISNLAAGNYSVIAEEHGRAFNSQFNNSITVGPSFIGADFTVDDLPSVTISAPTAVAVEGGAAGMFRISRTGPVAAAKDVFVFAVQGTATKGTVSTNDYYFSPDYVTGSPFQTFTIPAGSAFLDVTVPARNEGTSEGDESVTLVLGADNSYVNGAQNSATITIQDANTALPRVSLTVSEPQIAENSGSSLTATVTRTGATTAALAVPYTVASTSTATSGADFTALPGAVTIPIGATSASFTITPVNDSDSEPTETITLQIATGASFIANAAANSFTARITDDDTQIITLTASDASAQEVDRSLGGAVPDPGVFLLTRSGPTTAPVTIYYSVAGTALHGTDYNALPGSVVIPAGQTQAAVTIMPRVDNFAEGTESVSLALGVGFGSYQVGGSATATVNITDRGADKPLLEITAYSAIAAEPSTNGTFRITAKGGAAGNLNVNYTVTGTATNGTDFTTLSGSTTIALTGGTVTSNLTVAVSNDALLEDLETVIVTLTPDANPDPAYSLWSPLASATMFLRDDDQPTVFVDGQIGTGGADSITESTTGTTCKFFVSRTGSTTAALTVNYTMGGTATAGTDYTNTNLTGSVTIPAGQSGVDITFNTISDVAAEGAETVLFQLAAGTGGTNYARGPDAKLYILDDDANPQSVGFASPGSAGSESATSVSIPVTLNAPATLPVNVEYNLEAGARTSSYLFGTWLRIVRTGTSYVTSTSPDGVNWTAQSSTRTITMSSASYLAGIHVTSGSSGSAAAAMIDNVSVTGLSAGGTAGAITAGEIGTTSPVGGNQENGGVHQITAGGPDISTTSSDGCRFVYLPITNSANCTITARILTLSGATNAKAGVMIRESTAPGAIRMAFQTGTGVPFQSYRTTTNATGFSGSGANPTFTKPCWLRLERAGNVFTASTSPDNVTWSPVGGGVTLGFSNQLLIGLAVSSRSDGAFTQAIFDNVSITPAPSGTLQDRTVGFVNEAGWSVFNSGTYTLTASGAGILNSLSSTEDEGHFLSVPVTGNFTLTAQLNSLSTTGAQAGLMVRESTNYRARAAWFGLTGAASSGVEWRARQSATESGEGSGIDYTLAPGVLNFGIGEQTKNITLNVTNDAVIEPLEFVNVLLKNPTNAVLGGGSSTFTYTIVDDDAVTALPAAGFAAAASGGAENVTPAQIPVVLSEPPGSAVSVNYAITAGSATDGSDFTSATGTLNFAAGQTFNTVPVALLNDSDVENAETITITLSVPVGVVLGTLSTHTFTINDDDTPVVTIVATDDAAAETGDTGAFTITRSVVTNSPLVVNFTRSGTATSGTDFTSILTPGIATIAANQSSATVIVSPLQETTPEIPETVVLTLATGSGYTLGGTTTATVTIQDDDVNTVTLAANDALATEAAGNGGQLTLTRTGPLTATLAVTLSISGNATSGSDFAAITTSQTFAINQSSIVINVSTITDTIIEGDEVITVSVNSASSFIIGSPSIATITIKDDDLPPTVFISSPGGKSTIIDSGNGLMFSALGSDDGLPSALSYSWSMLFGPGNIVFGSANAANTTATFSAAGVYGVRVTVSDGAYTATDDVIVQSGGFNFANWITQDQGPPATRGISGESNGVFTLIGSGAGYTGTNDSGHMAFRQLFTTAGDATIIVRMNGLSGPATRLGGITMRDTSWKGARRITLALNGSNALVMNNRTTAGNSGTATTPASGLSLPIWLKLDRVGGTVTASHAPDVAGAPGTWVSDGTSTATMGNELIVGMIVSAGTSTSATATAVFDNLSVTPAITGAALHSEDIGNYVTAGSSSESAGTTTITGYGNYDSTGGHFRYQQVWGDCIVTARLVSHSGAVRGAQSGVSLRDTTDNAAFAFYGNTTTDGYQAHWRSTAGGANPSTLQNSGSGWVRLVRRGNTVNTYKAPNLGGNVPGTWTLNSGNLPVVLTGPLLVGLVVDSNASTTIATGTFTTFTVTPLNTAPVVSIAAMTATLPPFNLDATVADDSIPAPYSVQWSQVSGPGIVTFANANTEDTLVTLSMSGSHLLRLIADDTDARTFKEITFSGYTGPFAQWLDQNNVGNENNQAFEATADADGDGLLNLLEYAVGTNGVIQNANPQIATLAPVSSQQYLRLSIPKNPAATDVTFIVEACSDLVNWSSAGLIIETNTATQLVVRDNIAVTPGVQRFMRVRVTR